MAYGLLCKHCGQQETDHFEGPQIPEDFKVIPGYKVSLADCGGFELSRKNQRIQDEILDQEIKALKRAAGAVQAWM